MLRRAEHVPISHHAGFLTRRGWITLTIGRHAYRTVKARRDEYERRIMAQAQRPLCVVRVDERNYWQFEGRFYWDNDDLTVDQVYALLVTRQERETRRIERAEAVVAMDRWPEAAQRGAVPDDLKQYVWRRDGGRCRHCGSTIELQFDHIIPVALGGATSAENLQILCGPCNRRKGAGLTT